MARLRAATLDDLDTLVLHRHLMFVDMGGVTKAELLALDPVYRRFVRQRMRTGRWQAFVVEEKGAPIASGCVWIKRVQPRPGYHQGDEPYLLGMYTVPAHRGKGHARRIVEAASRWSASQGYPRITLHAAPMGRAVYERHGYERTWEMKKTLTPSRGAPRARRRSSRAGLRA